MAGREKNEELKTNPMLWTSCVTLTKHNSDLALSWCNISKNAPAAMNNRHNNNFFQSLTNFGHFCKKKNPNITSMKQEQYYPEYKRWRLCWRENYVLAILPTGLGKRLGNLQLVISSLKSISGRTVLVQHRFTWNQAVRIV